MRCNEQQNPAELKKYTEIGKTPVLLVENVNWIKRNEWHQNKEEANNFIKEWEKSWESLDPHSFIAQHSINFNSKTHDFEKRVAHILRIIGNKTFIKINIKNLNLFFYPEQRNLIYADFRQFYESNNFKTATNKKLFWKKEKDGKWRIIYEDT